MNLPIFPLPIFLLPGGVTQLRVFEQRYLNMVKNCNQTQGFAVQYQNQITNQQANWASWVDIIDFNQDENNMLLITVKCKELVDVTDSYQNEELLLIGDAKVRPFWPETSVQKNHELAAALKHILDNSEEMQYLYPEIVFDLSWLCARWLEILPIKFQQKDALLAPSELQQAQSLVKDIINKAV